MIACSCRRAAICVLIALLVAVQDVQPAVAATASTGMVSAHLLLSLGAAAAACSLVLVCRRTDALAYLSEPHRHIYLQAHASLCRSVACHLAQATCKA